ncbi:uncharacterized protein LOC143148438 isoform X1 [Ptiloglossa arizonensis]|uniref:uncharacterized protein LOC143148438 isoform X1 n=1 Tax=Ptiloglossa arizonensis TaxID=3350558 RepID=UPI003FA06A48
MEHSVFRDYCKAENSEDEEVNHDLQSRLYAEVYYASNSVENVDTKTDVKLETPGINNEELLNSTSTSRASDPNNKFTNNSVSKNHSKICVTNDAMDNSMLFETDNKSNVRSLCDTNEIELLDVDDKNNLNVHCMEIVHPQKNIDSSKNNKESVAYHKVESNKNNLHPHNTCDTSKDVLVKSEIKEENTEKLTSTQPLNSEKNTTTNQSSCLNSKKCNGDDNVEKIQEEHAKVNDSSDNILKRYEFSKLFINKLYLEKYDNLNRQLQQLEEREIYLREKEQKKINIENNEKNRQLDTHMSFADQKEKDTRYEILTRNEKMQTMCNYSEEITLLSSETESDSEESILEVPIPPKPQPVVIQLQDSDEGSETFSSDRDMNDECLFIMDNISNSSKNNEEVTYITEKGSDDNLVMTTPINDTEVTCVEEDIVLNCTEIQKGASSIKEIKEMNKNILNKDKDNIPEFQLPLETIDNSNVVYERDKNKSVSFADDIVVETFHKSNKSSSSRKRRYEDDNESCTNVKQKKNSDSESTYSATCSNQHKSKDNHKQESWEEYFFRPMSDNLKAFYNESRGHDIQEIQSKMSKDPRLWAILDEDLMPNLFKHKKFWNMKCNKCHCEGHQAYNCPQSLKPPRCHMCGTQGHTETRCPQKMCLTCGKKQGTFRKTCESCRTLYCNMCKAVGHKSTECPDLWRRFHQTTRNSEINVPENLSEIMKPADLLYCCNCTKRGHDSSTCYEYRWSQHFPTPAFVSNYGNRTECEDLVHVNTNEDIIPLSRKGKSGRTRYVAFSQRKDDLKGCCILYSYGAFQTKKPNGEEILKQVKNDLISKVEYFLKNSIPVPFLDQLAKVFKFEIKIFYNLQKVLMTRVRALMGIPVHIHHIFLYWLELQNDEKHLNIHVNLPRGTKKLLKLLTTKWEELKKQDSEDPKNLCSQIEQLKLSMINTQNSFTLSKMSEDLLDLRKKLMKIYHTKPLLSREAIKLQKMIKKLQKPCATSRAMKEVCIAWYFQIMTAYNKIFVPRTLVKDELECLFKKYYKDKKTAKNKGNENETTKKQNVTLNAYEQFLQSLQVYNKSKVNTQDKQTSSNINNSTKHSLNVSQKRDKQTPTVTSTTTYSTASNSIQSDNSVTNFNTEIVYTDRHNLEDNIAEHSHIYPIEVVQLPRNMKVANNKPVENTVKTFQKSSISPNLISLPLNKYMCSSTSSKNVKNDQLTSMPCTEVKSTEANIEKHVEVTQDNSEVIKISNSQQKNTVNSETNVTKKKKSKKVKKTKPNLETSSQLAENEVISVDVSIESKAKKVISDALGFNLPYMNKAVEEVEKRINDKSIKQEHIDVLQRLITLENDHREYVSSFCSYLK